MGGSALVVGVTGQTGVHLAKVLEARGVKVTGTSRVADSRSLWRLKQIRLVDTSIERLNPTSPIEVLDIIRRLNPDVIFLLTGPSSVGKSFLNPLGTFLEIYSPAHIFLSIMRDIGSKARFVNASSTDCFGYQEGLDLNERSIFQPVSPYGIAKASTFWATQNAREGYGLSSSNAILSNHESPLRGEDFVTHKIVTTLRDISQGKKKRLVLGDMSVSRDWLWAGDVAKALALIGEADEPSDYLVASGTSHTLSELVQGLCQRFGLNFEDVVSSDPGLFRPSDIPDIRLNPSKIQNELGWRPSKSFEELVDCLASGNLD